MPVRRKWRSSASTVTVLPLPEAGAARINPGAVMILIAGPAGQGAYPVQSWPQQDHITDYNQGWWFYSGSRHIVGAPLQRGFQHMLVGEGGVGDDGDGLPSRAAGA